MGKWGLASIVAALAGLPALAAAADQTVTARDDFWSPASVTVQAGEKVTWAHGGQNEHDLYVDGRQEVAPGRGWTYSRTFTAADVGTHPFECRQHDGMTGQVVVQAPGTPTPTPTPGPSPTPTPTPSPGGGGGKLTIRTLAPTRRTFARPTVTLRIDLSTPAEVRGTLERQVSTRFRRFGRLDFGRVAAGPRQLRFSKVRGGRRLTTGHYRLRLQVGDLNRTLTFRITRGR